jgi:hypothetical protein
VSVEDENGVFRGGFRVRTVCKIDSLNNKRNPTPKSPYRPPYRWGPEGRQPTTRVQLYWVAVSSLKASEAVTDRRHELLIRASHELGKRAGLAL